ncbi:unhealthy ribosome biogenesis protein 2 homolog isoform X1 [Parasteatoda tepidariorum]|uniref:unhealthy ribosome biogenesis protein 2 homolog isoform X1 n=2 Tax=Parasteatoda tepidariorum TaxID=114398 RepID=UPI001C724317|nr:uncharacterized protein LOC107454583 [Parasteatoda tepidariorum]
MTTARALQAVLDGSYENDKKLDIIIQLCNSNKCNSSVVFEKIIDWLINCITNKSCGSSSDIFSLWRVLHKVLTNLQVTTDDQAACLKSRYIKVFIEEIKNFNNQYELLDLIFNCITIFLKLASIYGALVFDSNTLLSLLFVTLDACCEYYKENSTFIKESKSLIYIILETLNSLPNASNESKLPAYIDNIKVISTFVYFATCHVDYCPLSYDIVKNLTGIVFNSKTGSFKSLLTPEADSEDAPKEPNVHILAFFDNLQKLFKKQKIYGNISGCVVASALIKEMMSCTLNQNRSDLDPLSILALLCAACGFDIPLMISTDSCCNNILKVNRSDSSMFLPLSSLLEACEQHPEYFLLSVVPEGYLKPSDWLEGILAGLLDMKPTENLLYWLKCFRSLTKLSVSLVEKNLTDFVKLCLLDIDIANNEIKQEFCRYFIQIVTLYSRLNQLPKFYVKLLLNLTECIKNDTFGELITRGQIYPEILQTLAQQFQDLSFGQILDLGKIFAEIYTTFANLNQLFASGKGALFFFSQIFSSFLVHTKLFDEEVPDSVYPKFKDLVLYITEELKKNVSVLYKEKKEVQQLQRSFLLLCYALGEIKIASYCCADEPSEDLFTMKSSNNALDCSLVHNFFEEGHADYLQSFWESDDKILSLLVFQLMIQKAKCLLCKKDASEDEKSHLQLVVLTLIQHAQENTSASASWDLDMCTLDTSNYGTAVWRLLLKLIPLVINMLNHKQLLSLCHSFHSVILNGQEIDDKFSLSQIALSHVKSGFFLESKSFQSAFVMSMWKSEDLILSRKRVSEELLSEDVTLNDVLLKLNSFRGKWMKYAQTTPKCQKGETYNPLWTGIKESCELLNQVLLNDSLCNLKMKPQLFNKIKLIECLPLEYLLPGNQMQCLVGLSVLFFLTPDLGHKDNVSKLAEQIATQMVKIFDGVRSIWLFDFVTSGPFLQKIVLTTTKLVEQDKCQEIKPWMIYLLESVVKEISRNHSTFSDLEFYLTKNKKSTKSETDVVFLLSLSVILEKLSQLYRRSYLSPALKETRHKIFNMSGHCFIKYLKSYKASSNEYILEYLLSCYTALIETIHLPDCAVDSRVKDHCLEEIPCRTALSIEKLSDKKAKSEIYLKFIAKLCCLKDALSSYLPEDFPLLSWKAIILNLENRGHFSTKEITSNLNNSTGHSCDICTSISKKSTATNSIILQEYEVCALQSVCSVMNGEQLNDRFINIANDIAKINIQSLDPASLQMNIEILKHLIESCTNKEEVPLSSQSLTNLLFHLHYIMNQLCQSPYLLYMVKIPVFEFLHFLVKKRSSCIPKQCLIPCLHSCLSVKLDHMGPNVLDFTKAFTAIWNIVYDILLHHPGIVLSSRAAYLSFVSMLLKSIVKSGSQDTISTCDKNSQHQLQLCAQNMDRLLTVLTRHKIELSKLVPYLVADYLDSIQDITLDSSIKVHLISGINRVLDLCTEDSLKMLSVNLNHSCRDMFSNIVKNHSQHKYHGTV